MMTDDMIRSMKEQMTPSDDVVTDLLAKIAALDASPASSEHVVSFDDARIRKACEDLTASQGPAAKAKKHTTKSIWYYSTAAVAGVIVLLSTFTIFGSADGNRAWDFIHAAINDPAVVTSPNHPDTDTPAVTDTTEPDGSDSSDDSELQVQEDENQGGFLQNLFGNKKQKQQDTKDTDGKDSEPANQGANANHDSGNSGKADSDKSNTAAPPIHTTDDRENSGSENSGNSNSGTVTPPAPDDGNGNYVVGDSKVTPGSPGTADISFNREILAESSVSNLTISGSNYVVEKATTTAATASEIKSISLEIPETSTTKHAKLNAKVRKVKNVSSNLLVAVDVDGFSQTLLYTSDDYVPETLGQFLSDAGLNSSASFAKAVFCKGAQIGYSSYQRFNVSNIQELVSSCAFVNGSAPLAKHASYENGNVHVTFKSTNNPTDSVINFGVSDNGYLYVKLTSGKAFTFHIGTEYASAFISGVTGQ